VVAPVKVAVFPLLKNKPPLVEVARQIHRQLKPHFVTQYDEVAAIGRRYRRQDEIGTPFCVTVDFQTLDDQTVTLRERDSMQQKRVAIADLVHLINDGLAVPY
jgi:glycyl-tRNA synthetase